MSTLQIPTDELTKDELKHCRKILHTLECYGVSFSRPGHYDITSEQLDRLLRLSIEEDKNVFTVCDDIITSTWKDSCVPDGSQPIIKNKNQYHEDIRIAKRIYIAGIVSDVSYSAYLDRMDMLKKNTEYYESYERRRKASCVHISKSSVRNRIFDRYNHKCANCGATSNLSIDHIKPVARGGADEDENLQVLCRRCNTSKKDRYTEGVQ